MLRRALSGDHRGRHHPVNPGGHYQDQFHGKLSVRRCDRRRIPGQGQAGAVTPALLPGPRFYLEDDQEANASWCLPPNYSLCSLRLCWEDFRPGDRVVLCPRHGCGFGERILLCCGEALFVSLPPGACRLTLCRCVRAVHLAVRMPPGANLCIRCCLETGRISWCWDFFRSFFNRCSGTRLLFGTSGSSGA